MRFLALLIAAQALFAPFSPARSEVLADRLVQVLEEVCIAPATPEGIVEAGNRLAAAQGWKRLMAAPSPLPILHNDDGPKIAFTSVWQLVLEGSRAGLFNSIIRPEIPGVKHSVCMIDFDFDPLGDGSPRRVNLSGGGLARSIEQRLGTLVTKDTSRRFRGTDIWFFSDEKARGNCGRQISILYKGLRKEEPQTLMFRDLAGPNDGNWNLFISEAACR